MRNPAVGSLGSPCPLCEVPALPPISHPTASAIHSSACIQWPVVFELRCQRWRCGYRRPVREFILDIAVDIGKPWSKWTHTVVTGWPSFDEFRPLILLLLRGVNLPMNSIRWWYKMVWIFPFAVFSISC